MPESFYKIVVFRVSGTQKTILDSFCEQNSVTPSVLLRNFVEGLQERVTGPLRNNTQELQEVFLNEK